MSRTKKDRKGPDFGTYRRRGKCKCVRCQSMREKRHKAPLDKDAVVAVELEKEGEGHDPEGLP